MTNRAKTMKSDDQSVNQRCRRILKTFLASGIPKAIVKASPLVSALLSARHAEAQGAGGPDRLMVIYVSGGGIHDFWASSGSGSSRVMGALSNGYDGVKTECNILLNMSHDNAGHGRMTRILSNNWSGSGVDSYDVSMAKQLVPDLPFTNVNLGVHSNGNGYLTRDGNNRIPLEDNPFIAFKLLFGSNTGVVPKHRSSMPMWRP